MPLARIERLCEFVDLFNLAGAWRYWRFSRATRYTVSSPSVNELRG